MSSINVVCGVCSALNRVPAERIEQGPSCGKCRAPVFGGEPLELSDANFERYVSKNDLPVLVDFWAPWCGPCQQMAPQFKQLAADLKGRVLLYKVNTEVAIRVAHEQRIRSIPTLILYQSGKPVAHHAGAAMAPQIKQWLAQQGVSVTG